VASNYPGSLDSFDTIASDKKTSDAVGGRTHRQMHNDLGDAIEAVQGELGTNPSGSYDTVKARIEAIEGSTLPQIDAKGDLVVGTADNTYDNLSVGTNDTVLVADSGQAKGVKWAQVPTAGIADLAVTAAKIANDTITATQVAANAIGSSELADSAVDTASIQDAAVTAAKLSSSVLTANLLPANASNFETDTSGWTASGSASISRDTGAYRSGAASLKITSTSDTSTSKRARISSRIAVTAGNTYTVVASLCTDGTATVYLSVLWYDAASGGTLISNPQGIAQTASAGWVDERLEIVAPVGATHAEISVYLNNAAPNTTFARVDNVGFWPGVGGTWVTGGEQVTDGGTAYEKTVYVNSVTGAAANPGTSALPCATLSQALTVASKCKTVVKVTAPATSPLRESVAVQSTLPQVVIESGDGSPWHLYGSTKVTSGWTSAGGGVYSRSLSVTAYSVVVTTLTQTIGDRTFALSLTKNTGTPTTPGEGEFGYSSGTLYIKLPASANPASHSIEIPNTDITLISNCPSLTLRDGRFLYHNRAGMQALAGLMTASDCVSMYGCPQYGTWSIDTTGSMVLTRCRGWRAGNDGANVSGSGKATLVNCDMSYNGDEGASAHGSSQLHVLGGTFSYNVQSGIGSINSSVNIIDGDPVCSYNMRNATSSDTWGAGINMYDTTTVRITSATCTNNVAAGLRIASTATTLGIDGVRSGVAAGNGAADNLAY
jgi:hypothetical protein